jgi:hypothetical protein
LGLAHGAQSEITVEPWRRRQSWPVPPPPENHQVGWRSPPGLAGAVLIVAAVRVLTRNASRVTTWVASLVSLTRHMPVVVGSGQGLVSYFDSLFHSAPESGLLGRYWRNAAAVSGRVPLAADGGRSALPVFAQAVAPDGVSHATDQSASDPTAALVLTLPRPATRM